MRLQFAVMLSLSWCLSSTANTVDAPFGIGMGTDVSTLPGCAAIAEHPGRYECSDVPRPHPDFKKYVVEAPPGVGACWIQSVSDPILESGYGFALRAFADRLSEEISLKYGSAKKLEFVMPKSVWSDSRYRLKAISVGDAMYAYTWPSLKKQPVAGVSNLNVSVRASGNDGGYLFLRLEFQNNAKCSEIEKKRRASAF